jgi:hypothetical protein
MPNNFKEYRIEKEQIMKVISEKKELFIIIFKSNIPEDK